MSEVDVSGGAAEQGAVSEQPSLTAGQMMRNAREAAGLHVAALAVSMKIPVKKLEALEADRLDQLHDAVFVRALASSVCRTLKIDPAPVLDRLPMNAAPRLNPDERGINAPFHTPGEIGATVSAMLSRPQVLIVLALLVAAAAVVFFPDIKLAERVADVPSTGTKSEPVAVAPLGQNPAAPVEEAPAPVTQAEAPREVMPTPVAPSPTVAPAPQTTPSPQPVVANPATNAPVLTASASAPARSASVPVIPTTGLVVFRARAASWVKVVDAKGVVQLSKTLAQGEVAGASGATPLSVVVGRVDMTDVEVRGQAYSMADVARENVARFEVK